jgi:hypothetical protein
LGEALFTLVIVLFFLKMTQSDQSFEQILLQILMNFWAIFGAHWAICFTKTLDSFLKAKYPRFESRQGFWDILHFKALI